MAESIYVKLYIIRKTCFETFKYIHRYCVEKGVSIHGGGLKNIAAWDEVTLLAYICKLKVKPAYWERVLKPGIFQYIESKGECIVENAPGEYIITGKEELA